MDDVRNALGYEKINVFGGSYGSESALVYLRRHASHVRSIAIESVAPPDYRLPLPFAKTIQGALQHLFADCAADTESAAWVTRPGRPVFEAGRQECPSGSTTVDAGVSTGSPA